MKDLVPLEVIENKIFIIRGHKVMLSQHLAKLYGVSTKRLNEQVKRNIRRFPSDFMLLLTRQEVMNLRSQIATSKVGGIRYLPYAFTEQGVAMLATVLNSERAIQVNIVIMRTFVRLRHILSTHKELADKLKELENKVEKHDSEIQSIFEAIRQLMAPPPSKDRVITGFKTK